VCKLCVGAWQGWVKLRGEPPEGIALQFDRLRVGEQTVADGIGDDRLAEGVVPGNNKAPITLPDSGEKPCEDPSLGVIYEQIFI
jgi:hypothetical protein